MEILELALKSRLPVVRVQSDDMINIPQVLGWIADCPVYPFSDTSHESKNQMFYTNTDAGPELYVKMREAGKTLVVVNVNPTVVSFNGGVMFPPKDMMHAYLKDWMSALGVHKDELDTQATVLLPAFGGLTLKEGHEVIKLTWEKFKALHTKGVNSVRGSLLGKTKGVTQVETSDDYYACPEYLETWMAQNLKFFQNPVHPSLTPRGLLFGGPPGTGKTAGAKFIADSLGVPLYRLDIGAAKGKYVGDSESNLQAALSQIDQAAPCVVLIDEVEKMFTAQGDQGVTSGMLGQMLWWLQEHRSVVFTVMTTNNSQILPPELYREGRIDATLIFQGVETFADGFDFMSRLYEKLAEKVGLKVPASASADIKSRAMTLFSSGKAVPQAKMVTTVHQLIKKALL